MNDPIRVLAVAGSLRDASFNRQLAEQALVLTPAGVEVTLFDGLGEIPPFDEDTERPEPPAVAYWREALRSANAVLVATPEYNGSIPGQLKNAFDWASRSDTDAPGIAGSAMYGRPVAVISASTGQFGAVWAANEMRKALKTQGARVVSEPEFALAHAHEAFDAHGQLKRASQRDRLMQVMTALIEQAQALHLAGVARGDRVHTA